MPWFVGGLSDVGRRDPPNEDAILAMVVQRHVALDETSLREGAQLVGSVLVAAADGLGGHADGNVASQLALRELTSQMSSYEHCGADSVVASVMAAHNALRRAVEDRGLPMGTTVTAALLTETEISVAHVGDTRLYHCRDGHVRQLTLDHSVAARLVAGGHLDPLAARSDPRQGQLLQALGLRDRLEIETISLDAEFGDTLFITSDGVHAALSPDVLNGLMQSPGSPPVRASRLVEAALEAGSEDNLSALCACLVA